MSEFAVSEIDYLKGGLSGGVEFPITAVANLPREIIASLFLLVLRFNSKTSFNPNHQRIADHDTGEYRGAVLASAFLASKSFRRQRVT